MSPNTKCGAMHSETSILIFNALSGCGCVRERERETVVFNDSDYEDFNE